MDVPLDPDRASIFSIEGKLAELFGDKISKMVL